MVITQDSQLDRMYQTLATVRASLNQLELRVELLEHYSNQLSLLVNISGKRDMETSE